jgi:DNA-binding winged helix-turn-helix (wHTH) protein
MNKNLDLQEGFYLDKWLVEPPLGRFSKNGEIVQIEPKIMEVLVLLAENELKVVRKETFLKTVWGDVNVIDHVLARAISELRRVFQDNPQNPRFIQTIPKIGYRLVMAVSLETFEDRKAASLNFQPSFSFQQSTGQISLSNLLFFFGGLATVFVFLAMLFVFVIGRHQSSHFQ